MSSTFLKDVLEGLTSIPKSLPSRYFYDAKGDELFQQIMALEEYYLPSKEREILQHLTSKANYLLTKNIPYEIIELGAGDGTKTVHLLKALSVQGFSFVYRPLDISPDILKQNKGNIEKEIPSLQIDLVSGNYFEEFPKLKPLADHKLVLFLGSNIGNFSFQKAKEFVQFITQDFTSNDKLMISFDMVKSPEKILAAYNDKRGVTAAFNLNLLHRINKELGANFDITKFKHFPTYNPSNGETRSYLVSLTKQEVDFPDGTRISFEAYEAIHTEISKKYFESEIETIAKSAQLKIENLFWDSQHEYTLALFVKE